jgi:hypothetical protein
MEPAIIWKPEEVRDELAALGLDYDGLVDCVRYAEQEHSFVTANDAVGFASMVVYDKSGRALRERYLGANWKRDNSHNQCAIRNDATRVRVVPCNFNECAGDRLREPTNRAPKGAVSKHKSRCNRTLTIPGLFSDSADPDDQIQTWLLGIHVDGVRPTTAELSLPVDFDGQCYTEFAKRIILLSGNEDDAPRSHRKNESPTEDADIVVRRK